MVFLLFVLGFVLLIKGADWLVEGAAAIAKKLGISELVIGLTIVSLGTSAPELVVNVLASFRGQPALAIGNVVGSNISNILLILGATASIYPIRVPSSTKWIEIPFSVLCTLLIATLVNDPWLDGVPSAQLSRSDGITIMAYFLVFMGYAVYLSRIQPGLFAEDIKPRPLWLSVVMILGGGVGLTLGGEWIVDGAVVIAKRAGLSESVIGLTIVAIGTSLPELAASVTAALKRNADIAIGNVVGSNIFNLLWILGLSATIKPLPFETSSNYDLGVLLLASILLMGFVSAGPANLITRYKGIFFVLCYLSYLVFTLAISR